MTTTFDFAAHFPIINQDATMSELKAEAKAEMTTMICNQGYTPAGEFQFQIEDLPLHMAMFGRVPVEPLNIKSRRAG